MLHLSNTVSAHTVFQVNSVIH